MRAWLALATCTLGCSYDLDALRNDAALRVDAVVRDLPMAVDTVLAPDVTDAGLAPDVGPRRPPYNGACVQPSLNLNSLRQMQGLPEGAPLLTGRLDTAEGTRDVSIPATVAMTCPTPDVRQGTAAVPPVRLFRYEVRRGPRVTVSTNTGTCGALDTRIFAWRSCDTVAARSMPLGCSDDDGFALCPNCASPNRGTCSTLQASLTLGLLVPGDVLWFGVHTLQTSASEMPNAPFRLWVGENALTPVALPTEGTVASRCPCQEALPPTVRAVAWPEARDYRDATSSFILAQDQTGAIGVREVPMPNGVTGVSAQFTIASIVRDPSEECFENPGAILDLQIGNAAEGWVTSSVRLDPNAVRTPLTVSFPYTPVSRSAAMAQPILPTRPDGSMPRYNFELRLRRSEPERKCVRVVLDLGATTQNQVILYGP